jgi:aminoglycoside phosphotransferase (APT) family kinase protein
MVTESLGERFEQFLAVVEPDRGGRVSQCEAITGGYSRISARAVVQWRDDTQETFILRGDPPAGSGVFTSDRDAEAALLRVLPGVARVRTPVLRWYDDTGAYLGSKCMIVDAALNPTDLQAMMAQADDVQALTDVFIDTFAALHSTPSDVLPDWLPRAPDWSSYFESVLDGYERMADRHPSSAPALRYVSRWARIHRPPPVPLALTHGDCQPTNVLITPDAPPLVIDWEFAHIGDPREDLGYYTQNPLQPNVYWADPEHFLARYRDASGLTEDQVNCEIVEYFLLLGMAKLLEQLFVATDAIGTEKPPGILAPYLINAISHQFDMFLSICERLS